MRPITRQQSQNDLDVARNRVELVYRPISALKLDPTNPRLHSRRQVHQIARSIQAFGFNVPILVDAQLKVIAGHGRVLACAELGLTEVPTVRLEHLSEAQTRAFMIADNRLTENSEWDERLLAQVNLAHFEAGRLEAEVELHGREFLELLGEQPLVPLGIFGQPVVRDHEGLGLRVAQIVETDGRDFAPPQQLTGHQTAMAGDYFEIGVDQHRHIETEALYAARNLADLTRAMRARVVGVEFERGNRSIDELDPPSGSV
jgi:ParB-like nuclease domain